MLEILAKLNSVKDSTASILITGESGVGKEVFARYVHFTSIRNSGPFVSINCAALSEDLLLSELFGHEKGAFTGAIERKIGKFELANGGTLFLDEIGNLPWSAQSKLLRVLQTGEIERVGGIHTKKSMCALLPQPMKIYKKQSRKSASVMIFTFV